jgi:hypothetical protein
MPLHPPSEITRRLWTFALAVSLLAPFGLVWADSTNAQPAEFQVVGDGVAYRHDTTPEPWSIHAIRFDRSRDDLKYVPNLGFFDRIGLNTLSAQVKLLPHRYGEPVAAINGDFYKTEGEPMPGDPRGIFVSRGEVVSVPVDRACLRFDSGGSPILGIVSNRFTMTIGSQKPVEIGLNEYFDGSKPVLYTAAGSNGAKGGKTFRLEQRGTGPWLPLKIGYTYDAVLRERSDEEAPVGDDQIVVCMPSTLLENVEAGAHVSVETATLPNLQGVESAIGGGPALLQGGKRQEIKFSKPNERHPRSAIGWNATHMFFVVVDGRQPGLSVGMTLAELTDYFLKIGCTEAMNFDGGGSTELILNGRIVNSPCFGHERNTATSLVVVRSAKK